MGGNILQQWAKEAAVPLTGTIAFTFLIPSPDPLQESDVERLIKTVNSQRKLQISLTAFGRVANLYRNLSDDQGKLVLIGAMATDLLFRSCQLGLLADIYRPLKSEVVQSLLPAVVNIDRMAAFDLIQEAKLLCSTGPLDIQRNPSLQLLLFNPKCPDGHYDLHLSDSPARAIAERILL